MTINPDDDNIEILAGEPDAEIADDKSLTDLIEQPAKVMRIGTMIKQLLEEVRAAPLDDASRSRSTRAASASWRTASRRNCARSWNG